MFRSLLLGLVRWLGPDTALEIEIFFTRSEDLAEPGSGQQLQAHSIRRPRVRMLVEHSAKPPKLVIRQPPVAPLLVITFDALGRVIRPPFPFDGKGEHFG